MRATALVLFYGYVLLLILAGAWGIVGARADLPILLHLPLEQLSEDAEANVLSQYRFLRAMELGFGSFALMFREHIFTQSAYNRLFLGTMGAGVIARLISLVADGRPSMIMFTFLAWEAAGVVAIGLHTRDVLVPTAPTPAVRR